MDGSLFMQLSVLLFVTVGLAFIVRLFKQPLLIAYIIAGIIAGPMFLNLLHRDAYAYQLFSQVGIVLLLFILGLNLNFKKLQNVGFVSLVTGLGQIVFTTVFGTLLLVWLKYPPMSALFLAVAMTFSSTIIIIKFLTDKKATETTYGKYTIGLMLVQDIVALIIMIGIGLVQTGNTDITSTALLAIKGFAALAVIVLFSKYVLPKILHAIADSTEFLFIFALAWCFGVASAFFALGFSLEIGAILAGIALSSSPYQLAIGSRIKPIRDFFLVLFFIALGSEMSIGSVESLWVPGIVLSVFILVGNPIILYTLFRILRFTRKNSFLAGLTAAQVSEFGFVILFIGKQSGYISGNELPVFTFVALTTIFASSYLITYNEQVYKKIQPVFRLFGPDKIRQAARSKATYEAWVIGYHRIGKKVVAALKEKKIAVAVIDYNPSSIEQLHAEKIPAFFGDISDAEFLADVPITKSELIILTIPSVDDQVHLMNYVRAENPEMLVVANAYYDVDAEALYTAGADYVMMPHAIGADWIASILKHKVT
ncbi:MAG: cation:proton antiporter, partial [Candidatus Andersenbacteria bacterium]